MTLEFEIIGMLARMSVVLLSVLLLLLELEGMSSGKVIPLELWALYPEMNKGLCIPLYLDALKMGDVFT